MGCKGSESRQCKSLISFLRQAILFDGLLPESKKDVRLSRLQSYANQLVNFRATHAADFPPRSPDVLVRPRDLLATSPPTRSKSLSASPFMVSVIIESLQRSKHAHLTTVVPGEADAFCAEAARQGRATILTSDSDLLVHDLGDEGRVILFRDFEVVHLASKGKCIKAVEYFPNGIANRLALPNLVKAAYFMSEDNHRSFTEAVRLAKTQEPSNPEYRGFEQLYGSLPVHSDFADTCTRNPRSPFSQVLSKLDPRISELVHQLKPLMESGDTNTSPRPLTMYFPFMIDDPTKTSTWRFGDDIRRIGYSALRLVDPNIASIEEVERKGTRIAASSVPLSNVESTLLGAKNLVTKLQEASQITSGLSPSAAWRCFAMETALGWSVRNLKPLPTQHETITLTLTPRTAPLTWRAIHASASVQSVIYSLRIVGQLLAVVVAFCEAMGSYNEEIKDLRPLLTLLESIPGLAEVLEDSDERDQTSEAQKLVSEIFARYRGTSDGETKAKKRQKKKVTEESDKTKQSTWQKSNPYAALS